VLVPGAAGLVARANAAGVPVVVVTNQAGIGRGYYGWAEFAAVEERVRGLLDAEGATVDAVLACPFHPDGVDDYRSDDHAYRKPNAGMLVRADQELGLALHQSWVVGDKLSDILAGRAAGVAGAVHLLSGHGRQERLAASEVQGFPVLFADGPADAIPHLWFLRTPRGSGRPSPKRAVRHRSRLGPS
jgi:D-glycero-D-manno-heptose 1,7-bisphosphate phosphatase